ncbi:MAG: tRNA threonylcarbamoyladenosine dehydratase [Verrucomicrobiota bacterium]
MTEDYLQRFGGIARLYGSAALPRLHAARVAVIGVGGVGSWAVEALARSGIGSLTLIDMDDVCITNTNRQLPAMTGTIGKPKVEVLAERLHQIAPECRCTALTEFFLGSNADRLLSAGFDGIIDAVDVTDIKALLIAKSQALGIPLIISGSAGGRRDPTQVRVADLGYAGGDPLIQQVRRRLREEHGFPKSPTGKSVYWGIPCVFSAEKAVYPQPDGTCAATRPDATETGLRLDCSAGFGAATFVTGTFGFTLAAEMIRLLTERPEVPMPCAPC